MSDYIKSLEEQNGELQEKLAKAEIFVPRWEQRSPKSFRYASLVSVFAEIEFVGVVTDNESFCLDNYLFKIVYHNCSTHRSLPALSQEEAIVWIKSSVESEISQKRLNK